MYIFYSRIFLFAVMELWKEGRMEKTSFSDPQKGSKESWNKGVDGRTKAKCNINKAVHSYYVRDAFKQDQIAS